MILLTCMKPLQIVGYLQYQLVSRIFSINSISITAAFPKFVGFLKKFD